MSKPDLPSTRIKATRKDDRQKGSQAALVGMAHFKSESGRDLSRCQAKNNDASACSACRSPSEPSEQSPGQGNGNYFVRSLSKAAPPTALGPDQDDAFWEIWAYPAVQEIVGGKEDGETVWSDFNFDVLEFLTDFEPEAVDISTRQHVHPSDLTFEGKFRGQDLFLHRCLEPPEDAEATEIVDLSGNSGPVVRDKE